ncbi:unnamed protein product [Urochloa humidicola]
MKALLKARFLPADYEQILFTEFQNCTQGNRSVSDYTEEFLRLQVRCNLVETEDQQVARYINGLHEDIQEQLVMQQIWSIDQAQALALKVARHAKTKKVRENTVDVEDTEQTLYEDNSRASSKEVEEYDGGHHI